MRQFTKTAVAAICAVGAGASTNAGDFTGAVNNNWFEAGNWNPLGVPTTADDVDIPANSAVTALLADAGGGFVEADNFDLASDLAGAFQATLYSEVDLLLANDSDIGYARDEVGLSFGYVELAGASIIFTNDNESLEVGSVSGSDAAGPAGGWVQITGGSITNVNDFDVGKSVQGPNDAEGLVTIADGGISSLGGFSNQFVVGEVNSGGTARGTVRVQNGSIRLFDQCFIGTDGFSGGTARGTLTLIDSVGAFDPSGFLELAPSGSSPTTTGHLELETSFFGAGPADIGDGATISMTLDGLTRAADGTVGAGTYSSMFLASAQISDATLNAEFTFAPSVGDAFDLIRLAQGSSFVGTTFDEINVTGITTALNWATQIVPGTATEGEIYRLVIEAGCEGDANADGVIDVNDISFILFRLGNPCGAPGCEGDANGDGTVNVNDISFVLFRLGNPCP